MNSFNIDGIASLQYNFMFKNSARSAVGLRYNFGISEVFDTDEYGPTAKNSGISAYISASF